MSRCLNPQTYGALALTVALDTQYLIIFSTSQREGESNNEANRELDSILESWQWGEGQS